MKLYVQMEEISNLFTRADKDNRDFLYEYEVYELIRLIGGETPLKYHFLEKDARFDEQILAGIPGDKVVIKIVSPHIIHKSDVGGVKIVNKTQNDLLSAVRNMLYEVPEKYGAMLNNTTEEIPLRYQNLEHSERKAQIHQDIKGFLICEFLPMEDSGVGNELLVSLRRTREFGMTLTAGMGGTDTELYAQRFKSGQAVVSASTDMMDANDFFELFKRTLSFDKLTGIGRGEKRKVTDEQLKECFAALIKVANHFSPLNPSAPFVIEELEINPFAFCKFLMVPLDGLCKFSLPAPLPCPRPKSKIENLLHPKSIAIMGVSAKSRNPGSIILDNIIANGFNSSSLFIIHPSAPEIKKIKTVATLHELPCKVDLLILAVSAQMVENILDDIIEKDMANSVIMIPGGLGEVSGSEEKRLNIEKKIEQAHASENGGPLFLGGNSLGVLSHPGKYDSLFIPEDKLPKSRGTHSRHTAFISQSGAYMITRMSKMSFLDPAYALSIGNQMDLTVSDLLHHFNGLEEINTIASYMEGFRDMDGLEFARTVKSAVQQGKEILFYKAGRTPEGKSATSGHTASLAGDYAVCKSCIREAGAMVADTFTEFEGLVKLSCALHDKRIGGNGLAAVSNAGYESVGIADNILGEDFQLEMASFSKSTRTSIQNTLEKHRLTALVDIKNPMDVTPMAGEVVYEEIIESILKDKNVHAVAAAIVPLTPVIETLPGKAEQSSSLKSHEGLEPLHNSVFNSEKSIVKRIPKLAARYNKPIIMVIDSGELYDPLAQAFQKEGLPVFRSADQAVYVLGKYIQGRLRAQSQPCRPVEGI